MEALAVLVENPFCKIWPCADPIRLAIGPFIAGAIISYLVLVYLLKYRKPNSHRAIV